MAMKTIAETLTSSVVECFNSGSEWMNMSAIYLFVGSAGKNCSLIEERKVLSKL